MDDESDPEVARAHPVDPASVAVILAAERRGIPWRRVSPGSSIVQLGMGRARRLIRGSLTALASPVGVAAAADPDSGLALLGAAGVRVQPGGHACRRLLVVGGALAPPHLMDGGVDEATQLVCVRAVRLLGLDVAAVEVDAHGAITAVEAAPKLDPDDSGLGDAIVANAFPGQGNGRVPIVSVTGSSGKTTVVRLVAHLLGTRGWSVGVATSEDVSVGGKRILARDGSDAGGALSVLADPATDAAVLEIALGGLAAGGLGYDWSDVAVMTNIQPEHLGVAGVANLDDIVGIKALVALRVRDGGTLVLNAEDERLAALAARPGIAGRDLRLSWFALDPKHPLIRSELAGGRTCYLVERGTVIEAAGKQQQPIVRLAEVPMTLAGSADHQVANLLGAVAACRALGMSASDVARALMIFDAVRDNPGRTSVFGLLGGHVAVEVGGSAAAFAAAGLMAARWKQRRVTGVISIDGRGGQRDGALLGLVGQVAAHAFDRILLGGEVARELAASIGDQAPARPSEVWPSEAEAVTRALDELAPGELVVVFTPDPRSLISTLLGRGAVAIARPPGPARRVSGAHGEGAPAAGALAPRARVARTGSGTKASVGVSSADDPSHASRSLGVRTKRV